MEPSGADENSTNSFRQSDQLTGNCNEINCDEQCANKGQLLEKPCNEIHDHTLIDGTNHTNGRASKSQECLVNGTTDITDKNPTTEYGHLLDTTKLGPDVGHSNGVENDEAADVATNSIRAEVVPEEEENEDENEALRHHDLTNEKLIKFQNQLTRCEQQLDQMRTALLQKENMIALYQRENAILEKEKQTFRREMELATKDKETTVIKFAMKEKLLLDAKKEKETVEKQLADAKKEIKNISMRFQAVNEDKSRMTYMMDEKCNEVRKYQRECEKLKSDYNHLESKLKYHVNKLNLEMEAKTALEKKLEEERNSPSKMEEKANEKLKMEYEANTILLKHEIEHKTLAVDSLTKEKSKLSDTVRKLQDQLAAVEAEKEKLAGDLELLREEHNTVQNSYSEEMLNSAKLRLQLEELQVLKTQNTLNDQKLNDLNAQVKELLQTLEDNAVDLNELRAREQELLSINKEMSESIVQLQHEVCLLKAKLQGLEANNAILRQEQEEYDTKYTSLEAKFLAELEQKTAERAMLTKLISEKTKAYEITKTSLDNIMGEYEASKHKHATIVKELQRELQKYKKALEQGVKGTASSVMPLATSGSVEKHFCSNCDSGSSIGGGIDFVAPVARSHSQSGGSSSSYHSGGQEGPSRRTSDASETETIAGLGTSDFKQGPSKKHLIDRILRLQQASARQAEKIDFLENHTLSLVAELQKKSKVVQHYMLREQAGALTPPKSDQNKSELAKYGNGVMSAIYNGIKGENKSMTLDLSLEINRKLQAVLEDTLLKNITLKENLDVLGLEVDNLTRKLRQIEGKD